jgi:hypothetical protein
MSRIALVGAAATAATLLTGCSSAEPLYGCVCPLPDGGGNDATMSDAIATFYGGVPIDATPGDAKPNDATTLDADDDGGDAGEDQ